MALVGSALTIFFVAASGATLGGGSTFDTFNGDLTDLAENDWNPVDQPAGNDGPIETINCNSSPTVNCGLDKVNDSTDNAYGQGAKEDDLSPSVVTGSIPPQKDDLSRFYVNKQKVGSGLTAKDFLYLAWERSNLLGSAHMDFEFNQLFCNPSATPTNCAANNVNPVRMKGDLLIDFDFGGSGPVGLFLHKWITPDGGNAANCEASNSLPCWDTAVPLTNAEASVNTGDVTDYNGPGAPRVLSGESKKTGQTTTVSSEFGEAGINLTDSGVFPQNQCVNFGSASLKSRSSGGSFSSELKDFIAPIPVNISNCGSVVIRKKTIGGTAEFDFTSSPALPTPADSSGNFTLQPTQAGDAGIVSKTFNNVVTGTQRVTESAETGWDLTDISCSGGTVVIGASGGFNAGDTYVDITVAPDATVTCTFTNTKQGVIKIVKDAVPNAPDDFSFVRSFPSAGTTFSLDDDSDNTLSNTFTSGSLAAGGTYTVSEDGETNWDLTNIVCVDDGGGTLDSTVTIGASGGFDAGDSGVSIVLAAGETVKCTFTNTSEHHVIVIVCHTATNTLSGTPVQELPATSATNPTPKTSISSVPAGALTTKGVTQADLCGIGGASFGGLAHADKDLRAQIGGGGGH